MPAINVRIEWDWPDEQSWLNPDNVRVALSAYCRNTAFTVTDISKTVFIVRDNWPSGSLLVGVYSNVDAALEHKDAIDLAMGNARHQVVINRETVEDIFNRDRFPWNCIDCDSHKTDYAE